MTATQELEQRALAIPDQAQAIMITDVDTYRLATDLLLSVKELLREVDNTFKPIIDKQYQAHREAIAQRKRHEDPLLRAEAILKPRIAVYLEAEKQKALAEQKKAQEAATIQEGVDAEARGDMAGADAAMNGRGVVAVTVPSAAPKVAGIAPRDIWSAEVTDKLLLIKAVAEGKAPADLVDVNQSVANQMARALKTSLCYPGLKPICVKTVAAGARL